MATTDLGKVKGSSVYSFPIDTLGMLNTYDEVTIGGSTSTTLTGYLYCFKVPDDLVEKLLDGDSIIAYLPESTRSAFAATDSSLLDVFYGGLTFNTDPPMRSTIVPYYFDAPLEQMTQWDDTTAPYPGSNPIFYGEIVNGDYVLYSMKIDITYDETSGEPSETITFPLQLGGDPGKSFVLLDLTGQSITAPSSSTSTKSINVVNNSIYDNALSITIQDTYAMLVSDDININGTIIPLLSDANGASEQPEAKFTGSSLQYNTAFYNALMAGEFPTIGTHVSQRTFVTAEQLRSNAVAHWETYDILDLAFTTSQDVTVSNNNSFLITDGHTVQLFIEADIVFNSAETANAYPILTLINLDGTSTFSEQAGGGTQYKDAVVNMAVTDKSLYTATGYIAQRNKSTDALENNYMPGASVKYAGYDMQGTKVHAVALFINALGVPDDGFLTTKKYNFHLSATYPIN